MQSRDFHLPPDADRKRILKAFAALGALHLEPESRLRLTFLDSFDWRLYHADSLLVVEQTPYQARTRWLRRSSAELIAALPGAVARFACQIPAGPLRDRLEPLLEMRALLPMACVDLHLTRARLLDKRGKTVLHLTFASGQAGKKEETVDRPLPERLQLLPVKGYPKALHRSVDLAGQLQLLPATTLLEDALAALERPVVRQSRKAPVTLTSEMSTAEALRRILRQQRQVMESNLAGTCADLDSEFLHDFRVAVRRTRTLLSRFSRFFPATISRFRNDFKWLGQITGPTRDLDVYLLNFPAYLEQLADTARPHLAPLKTFLENSQRQEQRRLARCLGSQRLKRLLSEWQTFLQTDNADADWPEAARKPIGPLADRRIGKAFRRVMRAGAAIDGNSPPAALHELRIDCKRLRYLMEFFQSLYPPKEMGRLIKALKGLQENLGNFNDFTVQAEQLQEICRQMRQKNPELAAETLIAIGMLIDRLHQRQQTERRRFAKDFDRFAAPRNLRLFRSLSSLRAGKEETS
ncbi:MAG: CHAD domain-containing protein [Desulfuromonadales bacterium]|nr:CHAD domain-containing protein [Desulfuromonadales bacterium]